MLMPPSHSLSPNRLGPGPHSNQCTLAIRGVFENPVNLFLWVVCISRGTKQANNSLVPGINGAPLTHSPKKRKAPRGDADIAFLFRRQLGEGPADLVEMERRHFFIEIFRQRIDLALILTLL